MRYTTKAFIESNRFPQITVICGSENLDKEITGIRIIEIAEMAKFLSGGETLLTSLQVYKECRPEEFEDYLAQYNEKNISAFILKKRRTDKNLELKRQLLKQYCEEQKIPLLEMPEELDFWTVVKYVMNRVFDKETARLKYFKLTHDNFNLLSFSNKIESNKTAEVIGLLSNMLGNPVGLYYSNGNSALSTDGRTDRLQLYDNLEKYTPDIITRFSYCRQKGKYVQFIVKIDIFGSAEVSLVITEKNRELSSLDYMAIENAIITLQYGFVSEFVQQEIEKKYNHDIVHSLLTRTLSQKEMNQAVRALGIDQQQQYQVVVFRTLMNGTSNYERKFLKEVGTIEGELVALLPDEMIFRNMERIVMIHRVGEKETPLSFQLRMEEIQEHVQKLILHRRSGSELLIGIGKAVTGAEYLADSYRDAEKALTYIDIARLVSGNEKKMVVRYSNLGFFQILGDVEDPKELLRYIPESLQILHDSDEKGELYETLRIYLENNQSLKQTSEIMFVHYRTVVYRIDKIAKMTGMNMKNTNEMLAVRIGIIIYKIIDDHK